MLLTRLYLRNFRVYEDELDLELPPGLVGIFGPNGAGKSTLLEAITFTLWGKARTSREEIRSAGVGSDCVTELEFEHEGHLYVVRRSLSGINATMRAEAHCDGLIMAEGATDTRRYVHSVLGMDDLAFKASVFAEQKQLAAFSSKAPAERRKLVLQLLGITPLDGARDAARRDARDTESQLTQVRAMLPDLDALRTAAADADAKAGAAEKMATEEASVAARAAAGEDGATAAFERYDLLRQSYDGLVIEGRAARAELDRESEAAAGLRAELAELATAAGELTGARAAAAGLDADRLALDALRSVVEAYRQLEAVAVGTEPPVPDERPATEATEAERSARDALAALDGALAQAAAEADRARRQAERSASLSGEGTCPLCGQTLGEAFAEVQSHRADEVAEAESRHRQLTTRRGQLAAAAAATAATLAESQRALRQAQQARGAWEQADARRAHAAGSLAGALAALDALGVGPATPDPGPAALDPGPAAGSTAPATPAGAPAAPAAAMGGAAGASAAAATMTERVAAKERAARRVVELEVRLERRAGTQAALETATRRAAAAEATVVGLRDRLRALSFDPAELTRLSVGRDEARGRARAAAAAAHQAALGAARARQEASGEAKRLADGEAQHALLADLEGRARHLSRLAVLLSEFRNTVVASVGPRLAAQAAELFGELTDNEYDQLQVDPETYELQISDGGHVYGLDRFSGSEIDLANLALRVAISEHVRFQSGGSVGLLVLDEIFGPLDQDRKSRMLQALEQLRGRFRQVLVVTHDSSVNEQLPNAIEVVKQPGRRATARVVTS